MEKYNVEKIIKGMISGITKYGIFIKFDNNYNGLVHISEISNKYVDNISKKYNIGDVIDVMILSIDNEKKQMKLSIKSINKKIQNNQLKERGKGFEPLKNHLDSWIEKKLEELNN